MSKIEASSRIEGLPQRDELDGLRGLAISLVFFGHFWGMVHQPKINVLGINLTPLFASGHTGVTLFFVLSGYLLFPSVKKFLAINRLDVYFFRRAFRIIPAYYCAIALYSIVRHSSVHASDIIAHMFLVHTFFQDTFWTICGVFWSLGAEVQFYICLPWLVIFIDKLTLTRSSIFTESNILFMTFALYSVIRVCLIHTIQGTSSDLSAIGLEHSVATGNLWCVAGGFLTGMFIQSISKKTASLHRCRIFDFLGIITFLALLEWIYFSEYETKATLFGFYCGEALICLAYGSILFATLQSRSILNKFFRSVIPVFLGKISYSLFLYHLLIIESGNFRAILHVGHIDVSEFWTSSTIGLCICSVIAFASYKFVEVPMISLGKKLIG